ncbi:MAG: ABC transporter substrate-binding protein [Erysipelotrichaceae bacterium]|nr:ABC transporter substrate-binding protein [Erysipelotrichaceae bacterium]
MKKLLSMILALGMILSLTACGNDTNNDPNMTNIGVIQLAEHPALDSSYEGFMAALQDAGYVEGENLKVDYQNAQGDPSNCDTIANKFVNNKVDLILAIATNAAQSAANATKDIPIVLTAVTDPEYSGLVDSNELPGGNVTGTSDLTPVEAQIDLLTQILPEAKTVAVMFNGAEDNSIFQANLAKTAIENKGMIYKEVSVSELSQIQSVVESLVGKVDAIYMPTDNLLAEGMATVTMITNENKIPTIVGEEANCENGGMATYGLSYYNLGYKAGEQAVAILKGETTPAEMPIGYLPAEDCVLAINMDTVNALGITIPDEILAEAKLIQE